MPDQNPYNPNAAWTSKKKEYSYEPPVTVPSPGKRFGDDQNSGNRTGHDDHDRGKGKRAIIIAVVIAVVVVIVATAAYFLLTPAPPVALGITFSQPSQALVGDPFPFSISYANRSSKVLASATLSLTLPAGISLAGQPSGQRVVQWQLGDIAAGGTGNESTTLIATGNPESVAHVAAVITYNPDASGSAQLQTDAATGIVVGSPAIGLVITAPADVSSGQNFTVAVSYVNNADHALGDVKVKMQYPSASAFTFVGSTVPPDSPQDDEWDVGPLAAGASGSFAVTGNMVGEDNAPEGITGTANVDFSGETYMVQSQTANLTIAPSPLNLTVALNGKQDYVAGLSDSLDYVISYANGSDVALENAVITAKFTGAMFDFSTLRSPGSFNSVTDTITWSGANTPALREILPGQSGTVTVMMRTKGSFPIRLLSDKNYALQVRAQITSPTVPMGTAASTTIAVASLTDKVGGLASLAAAGYWSEPDPGMAANTGPYPPQVNVPTEYTIHWDITNYSTDIANVAVSAYLQSGTTCTGELESNVPGSLPNCDPATGLVSWDIPSVPATTGVISPPAEAVFQVVSTPAVNQVGTNVVLLGPTTLTATDEFTSSTVNESAPAVDTSLPQDKTKTGGSRQVGE